MIQGCIQKKKNSNNQLYSLVETERAFAKTSEEKGINEAFLTYLSDEAIVFDRSPSKGNHYISKIKTFQDYCQENRIC